MKSREPSRIRSLCLGHACFDPERGVLRDGSGGTIALRPQSLAVLRLLATRPGQIVPATELRGAVWGETVVTDDSLVQCIADIRRAIGDRNRSILQTVPRRGYLLAASAAEARQPTARRDRERPWRSIGVLVTIALFAMIFAALGRTSGPTSPTRPRIVVLPLEAVTDEPRWHRLGRGISADIARALAAQPGLGVIGSETAYALATATEGRNDAMRQLGVSFVLDGEIEALADNLAVTVELVDLASRELVWSQRLVRPYDEYTVIRDDIVARTNASLVAAFWFGALNRAVAAQAKRKPAHDLSAYEEYLLGIENILWRAPDYEAALSHFMTAVAREPGFARAWMMIGTMQQWIGDVSADPARADLHARSLDAFRRAYAHEPNDPMVQLTMSTVHLAESDAEAARRAVQRAVALAPNDTDVLAAAAWQSIAVGLEGPSPLAWARRALELNPAGPPWHRLGLGIAAFASGDYGTTVAAMSEAPPHHKRFLFLASAHALQGNKAQAEAAAAAMLEAFPDYSMDGDYRGIRNAALKRLQQGARLAGIP